MQIGNLLMITAYYRHISCSVLVPTVNFNRKYSPQTRRLPEHSPDFAETQGVKE
jgi:hypothetical protein